MNAIKLPVEAHQYTLGVWHVRDSDKVLLTKHLSEQQARQIAVALNSHDALVEALGFYARKPEECLNIMAPGLPGNLNDWTGVIIRDGGDIARAALAKVEDLRKTQTNTDKP